MLVRTFMSAPAITVEPEMTCRDALRLFQKQRIRRAPVVAEARLVGILSERDLLRALPGSVLELDTSAGYLAERKPVHSVMTADPFTVEPDTHLEDAAHLMVERRIGGLPVVEQGRVIGMITESDLFRALIQVIGGSQGMRITALPPERGVASGHNDNVALICLRLSLRLNTLLTHSTPGGGQMLMVCATGARAKELPKALTDEGYTLIEASEVQGRVIAPGRSTDEDSPKAAS